jgi:hypothetical protein
MGVSHFGFCQIVVDSVDVSQKGLPDVNDELFLFHCGHSGNNQMVLKNMNSNPFF